MKFQIPEQGLSQHIGVLGKTGSGKTSTAKLIVEHVVEEGARVCILDPIKSDWWGITSSRDGKKPGLPFVILGGPHQHIPLPESSGKAIAELVANRSLPLSIIDMADFKAGGLQKFFVQFSETLWKKNKGVLYLVVEEAHEFAPKERSGIGEENMAVYWAKKLSTGSRTKGIRLIVCEQRTQALHNAVLGSLETMITHKFTAPADQDPVLKWFKANTAPEIYAAVSKSIGSLATGEGWIYAGGDAQRVQFPRIATYDNTATPEDDDHVHDVKTASVDLSQLRSMLESSIAEAEANDPTALKRRISDLERQVKSTANGPTKAELSELQREAWQDGQQSGYADGYRAGWSAHKRSLDRVLADLPVDPPTLETPTRPEHPQRRVEPMARPATLPTVVRARQIDAPARLNGSTKISAAGRKVLGVLSQFPDGCSAGKLTLLTGYKYSGSFQTALSELRTKGLIEGANNELMRITPAGLEHGPFPELPRGRDLAEYWIGHPSFGKCAREILRQLVDTSRGMTAQQLCEATGYEYSGSFQTALSQLRTAGVLVGKNTETMRASEDLFG